MGQNKKVMNPFRIFCQRDRLPRDHGPIGRERRPPVGIDAPVMALGEELLEDLVDGEGFVRPVVADGPVAVVLVLVDHEPVPGLIDAEGPGLLPVLPDEEAHPKQRHAPLSAVLLQLSDGPGMLDAPGRVLDIVGVLRPAVGAELLIGAQRTAAIGAGTRGRGLLLLLRFRIRARRADRHHV